MRMNGDRLVFSLCLAVWLVVALAPAAWAVLSGGGYETLVQCFAR